MKPAVVFALVLMRYRPMGSVVVKNDPYLLVAVRAHQLVNKLARMLRLYASPR